MPLEPGQMLSHYRLVAKIGEGGMGVVWKADDTVLGRTVAVKVLPEAFAKHAERIKRFEREVKAVAALNHPNIITLYSVEESDGYRFLTMELIEGQTLGEMIPPAGLPLDTFFQIALPLLDAVCAAHEGAVVHRDLKPSNVMVGGDGRLKVLDFGLAKLRGGAPESGPEDDSTDLTGDGQIIGTLPYVSPEQLRGVPTDHRSDIFSLGVMLYRMATGQSPFKGESTADLISSTLRDDPPSAATLNPSLPRQLSRIIAHSLEKNPRRRFQTALDLRNELGQLRKEVELTGASTTAGKNSVAILSFSDMSPEQDQEYFCDGLAEDVINSLSGVRSLAIAARSSAFFFKGRDVDIREIGEKLNVETVLEGSVQKHGNRLRVTAQLINVHDGYHLWSGRYDRLIDDVFAIQDEISLAIVESLKVELLEPEKAQLVKRSTDDVEAYQTFLRARYFWARRTEEGLNQSIYYFNEAVGRDTGYAPAYAGLADAYNMLGFFYKAPEEVFPRAKANARKALEIDGTLVDAHVSLGLVSLYYDREWKKAEVLLRRAIEMNPSYPLAHQWMCDFLVVMGRLDEALTEALAARTLDPLSLVTGAEVAWVHFLMRRHDQVIDECRKLQEMDRTFLLGRLFCGWAFQQKGAYAEALAEYEQAGAYGDHASITEAFIAHAHAASGHTVAARRVLDDLVERSADRYVSTFFIALIWAALGENNSAFEWLEKAFDEHSPWITFLRVEPRLDPLRSDPRFDELLRRMNLPE